MNKQIETLRKQINSVREESKKPVETSPLDSSKFEAAVTANGWTEQQKATRLVLALRGKAVEILYNISKDKLGE